MDLQNKDHPELREGEMWVTNAQYKDISRIGWKTKRVGMVAYNNVGKPVRGLYPVFRLISENYKKEMI